MIQTEKWRQSSLNLCELHKNDNNGHAQMEGEKPTMPYFTQRSTGNWEKLGVGEAVFPREKHTNCLSSVKLSAQTFIQVVL